MMCIKLKYEYPVLGESSILPKNVNTSILNDYWLDKEDARVYK